MSIQAIGALGLFGLICWVAGLMTAAWIEVHR